MQKLASIQPRTSSSSFGENSIQYSFASSFLTEISSSRARVYKGRRNRAHDRALLRSDRGAARAPIEFSFASSSFHLLFDWRTGLCAAGSEAGVARSFSILRNRRRPCIPTQGLGVHFALYVRTPAVFGGRRCTVAAR